MLIIIWEESIVGLEMTFVTIRKAGKKCLIERCEGVGAFLAAGYPEAEAWSASCLEYLQSSKRQSKDMNSPHKGELKPPEDRNRVCPVWRSFGGFSLVNLS